MNEQEKLQAIQNRNSSYDGKFIFGVKTTKLYADRAALQDYRLKKISYFLAQWKKQ